MVKRSLLVGQPPTARSRTVWWGISDMYITRNRSGTNGWPEIIQKLNELGLAQPIQSSLPGHIQC